MREREKGGGVWMASRTKGGGGVIEASKESRAFPGEKKEEPNWAVVLRRTRLGVGVCEPEESVRRSRSEENGEHGGEKSFEEVILPACLCLCSLPGACSSSCPSPHCPSPSSCQSSARLVIVLLVPPHSLLVPAVAKAKSPGFCSFPPACDRVWSEAP